MRATCLGIAALLLLAACGDPDKKTVSRSFFETVCVPAGTVPVWEPDPEREGKFRCFLDIDTTGDCVADQRVDVTNALSDSYVSQRVWGIYRTRNADHRFTDVILLRLSDGTVAMRVMHN